LRDNKSVGKRPGGGGGQVGEIKKKGGGHVPGLRGVVGSAKLYGTTELEEMARDPGGIPHLN